MNKFDFNMWRMFDELLAKSPLINEVVKIKVGDDKNKQLEMMTKLSNEKYKLFMEINKDIPLTDIYNYLKNIDYFEGDISVEIIVL